MRPHCLIRLCCTTSLIPDHYILKVESNCSHTDNLNDAASPTCPSIALLAQVAITFTIIKTYRITPIVNLLLIVVIYF